MGYRIIGREVLRFSFRGFYFDGLCVYSDFVLGDRFVRSGI